MPQIVFNLSSCLWGNNELLNENCWNDIDVQVLVRVKLHNFAYIWAIIGPISTNIVYHIVYHNYGIAVCIKNDISYDLKYVGQGHHLQKIAAKRKGHIRLSICWQ